MRVFLTGGTGLLGSHLRCRREEGQEEPRHRHGRERGSGRANGHGALLGIFGTSTSLPWRIGTGAARRHLGSREGDRLFAAGPGVA